MDNNTKPRQSLIDLALVYCGNADEALPLALMNSLSLTDEVTDRTLEYPPLSNTKVARYFAINSQPATAIESSPEAQPLGGINYMGIEIDFVVS